MSNNERKRENLKQPPFINKIIHEPARLLIISYLYVLERADLIFLQNQTQLTWGNISSHVAKLEEANYVNIEKKFVKKKPQTLVSLTDEGRKKFEEYRTIMRQFLN
ncbi:MAG: winged helix-turn-helix domain-containing protein [Candidatus Thorarchaeota archaeon]